MRTKTSPKWFEATALTFPQNEEGLIVRKSHTYVFDAKSFAEAEERIADQVCLFPSEQEPEVTKIAIAPYREVFLVDEDCDKVLSSSMIDYRIVSISETQVIDVVLDVEDHNE